MSKEKSKVFTPNSYLLERAISENNFNNMFANYFQSSNIHPKLLEKWNTVQKDFAFKNQWKLSSLYLAKKVEQVYVNNAEKIALGIFGLALTNLTHFLIKKYMFQVL